MDKKTINSLKPSFIQAINIAELWCKDWENELISDEVLADRIDELINTRNGLRGFFAYTLSDINCSLLDKLPIPIVFKFRENGEKIVDLVVKNLIMSSAQVINHQRDKNKVNENISRNISNRCVDLLKELDTKLVTMKINEIYSNLDNLGNSFNIEIKYDEVQKDYIREKINKI